MQIIPIRDLKNTVEIERLCSNGEPVFVTKNGYGRLVVMDIDCYEKTMAEIEEAKVIMAGLKDYSAGKIAPGEAVIDDMRNKYGI